MRPLYVSARMRDKVAEEADSHRRFQKPEPPWLG